MPQRPVRSVAIAGCAIGACRHPAGGFRTYDTGEAPRVSVSDYTPPGRVPAIWPPANGLPVSLQLPGRISFANPIQFASVAARAWGSCPAALGFMPRRGPDVQLVEALMLPTLVRRLAADLDNRQLSPEAAAFVAIRLPVVGREAVVVALLLAPAVCQRQQLVQGDQLAVVEAQQEHEVP